MNDELYDCMENVIQKSYFWLIIYSCLYLFSVDFFYVISIT